MSTLETMIAEAIERRRVADVERREREDQDRREREVELHERFTKQLVSALGADLAAMITVFVGVGGNDVHGDLTYQGVIFRLLPQTGDRLSLWGTLQGTGREFTRLADADTPDAFLLALADATRKRSA
jgi:hypothetical protein